MSADAAPLVVHVIHHLVVGGMENTLVNLINHMPARLFRHAVICIDDYSSFRDRIQRADVEVIALHRPHVGVMAVRRAIYRICRRLRPAIVHTRNLSGLDALLPAWLARVPFRLHSEHGWDVDNLQGQQWKPALLRRLHAPLVTHYLTVSRDLARFLETRIGISPTRISQIYNGVDTSRFVPKGQMIHDELPVNFRGAGLFRIGTVGRLQAVKDQALLLRAAARLLRLRSELRETLRMVIVGDGPMFAPLNDAAQSLGLADITWFAGASQRVPQIMQALDVFVLPSLNEGVSNTILEAMAAGLPVLASRVGGNPELVDHGETGFLFDSGDEAALCARLQDYCDEPALCDRHASAARARAEKDFSLQAMVRHYADLYRDLIRGQRHEVSVATEGEP